jgi:hypothetical protein
LNLKIKKLKLKIEWLRLELDETNGISAKCLDKFYKDFAYCIKDAKENEPVEHEEPFSASHEITNKLFKEIALKTHPDKKQTETNETFVEANKANEKNDLSVLLNIAKKLDIDVTDYVDNDILLEQHANELEYKIHQIKRGIPWTWYHAKSRTNDMRTSIEQILTESNG